MSVFSRRIPRCVLAAVAAALATGIASAEDSATITIHADRPGVKISPSLYGVFFEEINHAGDGGLFAELVKNRTFKENDRNGPTGWSTQTSAGLAVKLTTDDSVPLSAANPRAAKIEVTTTDEPIGHLPFVSVVNDGYWGMGVKKDAKYTLNFYARGGDKFDGNLIVAIESHDAKTLASQKITGITGDWKKYTATFTASADDDKARLVIGTGNPGTFFLNVVSLMPDDTFMGHGLRKDLAQMVADLHPAFMRFPGGCYVEGGDFLNDRYLWKKTIGDPVDRPGHVNATWHYWSTDGLGYHEYLQFCQDIGAAPLYVFNVGFSHRQTIPLDKLQPFIDDGLDAIEYANGPVTSKWGAERAKNGHPEPFNLKYVEIGNENGMNGNKKGTFGGTYDDYQVRFKLAYEAVKARYPEIQCIANTRVTVGTDYFDDHVYERPGWFWGNQNKYDHESRTGPKVYVGEYADTIDCGKGNLRAALAEAAYMNGFERNGDVVLMSSYAPMFVQTNDRTWNPDMMVFDSGRAYPTPSYWVQQLYANNRPDQTVATDVKYVEPPADSRTKGSIGLATWNTQAEFKDVKVESGGKTVYSNADATGGAWTAGTGRWSVEDGVIRQTDGGTDHRNVLAAPALAEAADYTLTLKARKTGGAEGFIVLFRVADDKNYYWWNVGGWANTLTGIEKTANGDKSELGPRVPGHVDTGKWYDLKIELKGHDIRCSVDGRLVTHVRDTPPARFTALAGTRSSDHTIVVKIINGTNTATAGTINLEGGGPLDPTGEAVTLTSASDGDENSFDEPAKITPRTTAVADVGDEVKYTFPPQSLTILKLRRR